jgi:molecular chaperone HtpG
MSEQVIHSKREFKAEVRQLLDILVHSLYTNKEIFLRELISNSSDALDKLRYEKNRGAEPVDDDLDLEIRVSFDKDRKLLTVSDTGIGMTEEEVIENLGTIAHSGSAELLRAAQSKQDLASIIGRFGVGFYSVFMVAREVVVTSRSYRKEAAPVRWRSDGTGEYEVAPVEEPVGRGTRVELHLRDDALEFAEDYRIKTIIKKHSNFISFPIFVGEEHVNTIPALWREPKFNIKKEQYTEFYKFITYDTAEPLETMHFSVDAPVQFHSLLFIPAKNPDLFGIAREPAGVDIYARRVLIQHGNTELLPEYLGFIRGVVDSEDLPLNISRETFQENVVFHKIGSSLTKQILSQLRKLAEKDKDRYTAFWKEFGKLFKAGYMDFANRDDYAELLRFHSSALAPDTLTSLEEYAGRAKPGQSEMYYASGPNREAIESNPHLEILRAKGLEVLYLHEPIDEFALEGLHKFKDFELRSVEHADPRKLDSFASVEGEQRKAEALSEEDQQNFERLLDRIKLILGDRVTNVKASERLKDSPCCLVNPDGQITSSMDRIMRIVGKDTSIPKKVLEVNRDHHLIRNLLAVFKRDPRDSFLSGVVEQMFESALLLEGYLNDPHQMVGRIQRLMDQSSDWYLRMHPEEAPEQTAEAASPE